MKLLQGDLSIFLAHLFQIKEEKYSTVLTTSTFVWHLAASLCPTISANAEPISLAHST